MENLKVALVTICLFANLGFPVKAADADPAVAAQQARVQQILNKFVQNIGKDPTLYTIVVEKSDTINAYATIGRRIVVYTGLINHLSYESALAFVVAHELGHIEERHAINGVVRQGFFSIVKSIFFKQTQTTASQIYDGVTYMGGLHYSRGSEEEADLFAVNLMNKLYCDATGKLEFFEKNMGNQSQSKLSEYFSTHPLSSTRLGYLKEKILEAKCKV